jgi:hypothetical protein
MEQSFLHLALPDDVVLLVFAKLDFADITLYATYRHGSVILIIYLPLSF